MTLDKEAQRLAVITEDAIINVLSPYMGDHEIYAQILKHVPLHELLVVAKATDRFDRLSKTVETRGHCEDCNAKLDMREALIALKARDVLL